MTEFTIGIDMGGTKTLAIAYTKQGKVLNSEQIATDRYGTSEKCLSDTVRLVDNLRLHPTLASYTLAGVGIGVPGPVTNEGIFTSSIILPNWHTVNIGSLLEEKLQVRVAVDNDANMAGVAEWWARQHSCPDMRTLLCLTLGTGVGGAIIFDGHSYRGIDGVAGELGHLTLDLRGRLCECGTPGCLNAYVSGTAIGERYRERLLQQEQTGNGATEPPAPITGLQVAQAARQGDQIAEDILAETVIYLGAGLAALVNIFNPDCIVLTGGVAGLGELFLQSTREELRRRAFVQSGKRVSLEYGSYGQLSGAVGSALAAFKVFRE